MESRSVRWETLTAPDGGCVREIIRGPLTRHPAGAELTATLRPEDVILSLAPAEYVSAQNQILGRITSLVRHGDRTLCCVDIGTDLFVDVTHCSAAGLELRPDQEIWCLFKAHAVKYLFEEGEWRGKRSSPSAVATSDIA